MTWRDGGFMLIGAIVITFVEFAIIAWFDRVDMQDGSLEPRERWNDRQ